MELSIDYMIHGVCNLDCPYCYGSNKYTKEISKKQKFELLDFLSKYDNIRIIVSGGEPLINPDIIDFCSYANKLNIKLAIQTNSIEINILEQIIPYLDWVAFPIDGIKKDTQHILRTNINHTEYVINAIKIVDDFKNDNNKLTPKIKIGTVATIHNVNELQAIFELISSFNIDIWKVYQLRRRGGKMNDVFKYNKLSVSCEEIQTQLNKIDTKKNFSNLFFKKC